MCKRFIAVCLMLALILCSFAYAEEDDRTSIRHRVTGDVSEFVVEPELDQFAESASEGEIGTDVYLYVDPYSASYVTFIVVDEDGNPVRNASIWLTCKGATEFYGQTDYYGVFTTYLFKDTNYGYTLYKQTYRPEADWFRCDWDTKTIRVVMRKYQKLDVVVMDNGEPVPGIKVEINGEEIITGPDGTAQFWPLKGTYDAVITLPDGTQKKVVIDVQGYMTYIVDISQDAWPDEMPEQPLETGGGVGDMFIVFDKHYNPEDYDLTEMVFTDDEIKAQLGDELSKEEIEEIVAAYHAENEDYLHIVAEPDKIQHEDAPDEIVVDEEGVPVYSQRSLILNGRQLLAIEEAEMGSILFENEYMGVWLDIADLYNEDMAKLFWLLGRIEKYPEKYSWFDEAEFEANDVPYYALQDVSTWNDSWLDRASSGPVLDKETFGNSYLEVRITPALEEEVLRAALGVEENIDMVDVSELVLISDELRVKWLNEYLADGYLSDTEYAELEEICVDGTAYRVQLFMSIGDFKVNVTDMVDSLEVRMDVNNEAIAESEEYAWAKIVEMYIAQPELEKTITELRDEHFEALCEEFLANEYDPAHGILGVRNEDEQVEYAHYKAGEAVFSADAVLDDCVTEVQEFLDALKSRLVDIYDVDVRHRDYVHADKTPGYYFYPVVKCSPDVNHPVERDWQVALESKLSGLYLVREIGCDCLEEIRAAIAAAAPVTEVEE